MGHHAWEPDVPRATESNATWLAAYGYVPTLVDLHNSSSLPARQNTSIVLTTTTVLEHKHRLRPTLPIAPVLLPLVYFLRQQLSIPGWVTLD